MRIMLNLTHEDNRRKLYSFPEAKVIEVKEDCVLGNHYHKLKTEYFILTKGEGHIKRNGISMPMTKGLVYLVKPNVRHEFKIKAGSVLVGLNSEPYDPSDDYK